MDTGSRVSVTGTVTKVRFRDGEEARFSIRRDGELFAIRAFDPDQIEVCKELRAGDVVTVVGELHSFVFKRCQSHHTWIKALALVPGGEGMLAEEVKGALSLLAAPKDDAMQEIDISRVVADAALAVRGLQEYMETWRRVSAATSIYPYVIHLEEDMAFAVEWLDAFASITGYSTEETHDGWTRAIHPDDVERANRHLQAITSGQPDVDDFRVSTRSGEVRWVRDHAYPVWEDGAVVRVYGVGQDITDLKWLEVQVLELQRMAMVNRLAGGIAHEFNNLLTIILSHAELLLYRLREPDPAVRGDVEEITDATERAAWLTHQLLAFTRRQMVLPELLDLNGVVVNLGEMLQRVIREGVELVIVTGLDAGYVKADQGQVEQMIINFVIHACDRMPEGGRLTLETAGVVLDETQIGEMDLSPGPYVRLVVSDTGPEMDRAELLQLGGDQDDDRSQVGLHVAYRMAGLIDAHVQVSSRPEETTFGIYLPRLSGSEVVETVRQVWDASGQQETVLVVEDEDRVRSLVSHILQINGFIVLEARSGEEALDVCRGHRGPVHVVVSDVMLPGMRGPELVERLTDVYPQLRAVFISGYVDAPHPPPGGASFLRKPFAVGDLVRAVYRAMSDDAS